jgi:hypothetical protein
VARVDTSLTARRLARAGKEGRRHEKRQRIHGERQRPAGNANDYRRHRWNDEAGQVADEHRQGVPRPNVGRRQELSHHGG